MTPSKILFYLSISFIAGIFISSVVKIPPIFSWGFLFLGVLIIIASVFFKRDNLAITSFCIFFLVLGIIRLQISEFNILNNELRKLNNKGETTLIGKIISEPDVRENSQKLKIKIENPKGIVLATVGRYPEYKFLDKLKIIGKLEIPAETEDFSYKNYLLKDGIYSVMAFPKVELLGQEKTAPVDLVYAEILKFKQKLRESIRKNYSPPQSLILEGTILGDNGVMSQDLKNKLNITGLRHIIAVSGTHVVILSAILISLLLAMGLWRQQAFYVSVTFIWIYIILTGLPASGVRAGIMGTLFLLAEKLGRQSTATRIITMAGAVMVAQNPLLLLYDVGFQLSFLASMGIIYFNPFFTNLFIKFAFSKKFKVKNLINIISTTFAAQIFTLPVMVYNFGNISLVSPITNLLVLPIVSGLMIFGFLSSILGIMSQSLGWIFSVPCWFLLTYFIKVIDIFSQPWAVKTIKNIHWIWIVISYFILSIIVYWLQKNKKPEFL
ncbi:MAG: ComEC/Rec2 family competence protein [Candidatus Staskawiczbacteria bacterium]|nr:ComEC/Rec2 family competence protein [Candidatus Staskawiczbacteria bacterium]